MFSVSARWPLTRKKQFKALQILRPDLSGSFTRDVVCLAFLTSPSVFSAEPGALRSNSGTSRLSALSSLSFSPLQGFFNDPFIRPAKKGAQMWENQQKKKKPSLAAKLLLCEDRAFVELTANGSRGHRYELIFP